MKLCKDCYPGGHGSTSSMVPKNPRPAPHPGPRCATHHRQEIERVKEANHARYVEKTYCLANGQYDSLYVAQGGTCAICRVATGKARRLSVDHDHACCPGSTSCGKCVRGLLCRPCNDLLGHARDQVEFFRRAIRYLEQQ